MEPSIFDELEQELKSHGPEAAIDRLCSALRAEKDYANLFYALLLKKRHALGVSPVPTESSSELPEAVHEPYENAIREAGRLVGKLYLEAGDIPRAWVYFRMLGEPGPVAEALEHYKPKEEEDVQPLIDVAFHQGVNPRKGFDWMLDRLGICNSITTVGGTEFPQAEVRDYCIKGLVRALHAQLQQRLTDHVLEHDGPQAEGLSVRELIAGRHWLFQDDCYHVDVSHLSSVVQLSVHLSPCPELELARELCEYGERLSTRFRYPSDPPFEDLYRDYGKYLAGLAGADVENCIAHFHNKIEQADPNLVGSYSAEVLVTLLVRLQRPAEALAIARRYLAQSDNPRPACPSIAELCRLAQNYRTLAEIARLRGDAVHFMAGLLAADTGSSDVKKS